MAKNWLIIEIKIINSKVESLKNKTGKYAEKSKFSDRPRKITMNDINKNNRIIY